MEFKWHPKKAIANVQKHDISFQEAATVFGDPLAITFEDPDHSLNENHYINFGYHFRKDCLLFPIQNAAAEQES